MTTTLQRCIAQGCRNTVEEAGTVCGECQEIFDGYVRYNPDGYRATPEELAAADATLRRAHERQIAAENSGQNQADGERRRNQLCWLCEQRRTCTKEEQGWECDDCRQVQ